VLAALASGLGGPKAQAQPGARLEAVYPAGGRRGESVAVTFSGRGLQEVRGILFSGSGVAGEVQKASQVKVTGEGVSASLAGSTAVQVRVTVARDAALGPREVRLVTGQGVTDARFFEVGDLPEWTRPASPTEGTKSLTLPMTVNGRFLEEDETHSYSFQGVEGQHLIFDVKAERLGSSADLSAAIMDSTGKEVASATDTVGLDPLISFTVPASGSYTLQLKETGGHAGQGHLYRVVAGALPYIQSAFPQGGQRGTSVEVTLGGVNLNGTSAVTRVDIAADAPLGNRLLQVSTPYGPSNAWPFLIGDLPEVLATPRAAGEPPQAVAVPIVVNGRILQPKESHLFRFTPRAGETLIFEVMARRLGSPLDSLLIMEDGKGQELARNDDFGSKDSEIRYTFPTPAGTQPGASLGEYRVRIQDAVGRGGPDFNYRLSLRRPSPDFRLEVTQDRLAVPAGGKYPLEVKVTRIDGFEGPVGVEASGLPAGVTAMPLTLQAGESSGWLTLAADANAPRSADAFTVQGLAQVGGTTIKHPAPAAMAITRDNDSLGELRLTTEHPVLAVVDPPPFSLEAPSAQVSLRQRGQVQVLIRAKRKEDFSGPIRLGLAAPPEGIVVAGGSEIRAGENQGLLTLLASDLAAAGPTNLKLQGTALLGSQEMVEPGGVLAMSVVEAPGFRLKATPGELSLVPQGSGEVSLEVERVAGFTGDVNVSPVEVAGVKAPTVIVPSGATSAKLPISALDSLKPGATIPLKLEATAHTGTEAITRIATVTLKVLEPPDFAVSVGPDRVTLQPGQTRTLTVTLARKGGYAGPVSLAFSMPPIKGVTLQVPALGAGETSGTVTITAAGDAAPTVVQGVSIWGTAVLQGKPVTREAPTKLTLEVEKKPEPVPPPEPPKTTQPATKASGKEHPPLQPPPAVRPTRQGPARTPAKEISTLVVPPPKGGAKATPKPLPVVRPSGKTQLQVRPAMVNTEVLGPPTPASAKARRRAPARARTRRSATTPVRRVSPRRKSPRSPVRVREIRGPRTKPSRLTGHPSRLRRATPAAARKTRRTRKPVYRAPG
jgi:hypothetical protein